MAYPLYFVVLERLSFSWCFSLCWSSLSLCCLSGYFLIVGSSLCSLCFCFRSSCGSLLVSYLLGNSFVYFLFFFKILCCGSLLVFGSLLAQSLCRSYLSLFPSVELLLASSFVKSAASLHHHGDVSSCKHASLLRM